MQKTGRTGCRWCFWLCALCTAKNWRIICYDSVWHEFAASQPVLPDGQRMADWSPSRTATTSTTSGVFISMCPHVSRLTKKCMSSSSCVWLNCKIIFFSKQVHVNKHLPTFSHVMMSNEYKKHSLDAWPGPSEILRRGPKTYTIDWKGKPYTDQHWPLTARLHVVRLLLVLPWCFSLYKSQ